VILGEIVLDLRSVYR